MVKDPQFFLGGAARFDVKQGQTANVRRVLKKNHASSGSQGRTWNLYTNTCTDLGFGWYSSVGQSCHYIHI